MAVKAFGVRHHGPGSARALRAALAAYAPDAVLIEGPADADGLLPLAAEPGMEPPVAILAHVPGEGARSAFWPFAAFSPEWQAIRYALEKGITVRFCDLPAAHTLAAERPESRAVEYDPLGILAEAAGYDDAERWWEDVVEHRNGQPFDAVAEAMTELRAGRVPEGHDARREAYMRRVLRRTMKEGHDRVAVVCGAWHVPALLDLPTAAADDRVLRGMPKAKVSVTWVPWTYGRLASWSGYGAGVRSPGWYDHLFGVPDRPVERWLIAAAGMLREEGLPVSPAHVIEAVRLTRTLAALRDRPLPGLAEVTEATRAVLCDGDELPLELVQRRLVVGERLGSVPPDAPAVPLQRDLRDAQRRLRLKPSALDKELDLDLRRPIDLERSRLLHRLRLIGVDWGTERESWGTGTFRESWTLIWRPELDVDLIEASAWGTTVAEAAAERSRSLADSAVSLATLTELAGRCLLAGVPPEPVLAALAWRAAVDTDVMRLMAALPALVRAARYGDVRGTPVDALHPVIESLFVRICVGLPKAVLDLDDDAAGEMLRHIDEVHGSLALLEDRRRRWLETLTGIAGRPRVPGLIDGRLSRLLFDGSVLDRDEVAARLSRAVSPGVPPAVAAAWIEGFLSGGGLLLVHDEALLGLVDEWIGGLPDSSFTDVLPLLRRTFGAFAPPERRAVGERLRPGGAAAHAEDDIDDERAAPAVRTVRTILGRAERAK